MKTFKILIYSVSIILGASFLWAQNWHSYTQENSGLVSNEVRSICIDGYGFKWFGTGNGLSRFDGSTWFTVTADTSRRTLADNGVNDIAFEETSYGPELWLATDNGVSVMGISLDAVTRATPYREDNTELVSNTVYTALVDSTHIKWFGTDSGVSSFTGSDWSSYTNMDFLSNNHILSIGADKNGWKYIGTKGGGVSRIFDNGIDAVTSASPYDYQWSGLLSDSIYAVYVLESGDQWYGTDEGAAFHDTTETKEGWTVFTADSGLVHNFVQALAEDKNGTIWFGTQGGVSSFDGLSWTSFTSDDSLVGDNVRDIAVDLDGSLWFATDQGVSHFTGTLTSIETIGSPSVTLRYFRLLQNYPNPFNAITSIPYQLLTRSYVQIDIYNIHGQRARRLVNREQSAGFHSFAWDGRQADGLAVSSGVYVYRLRARSANGTQEDSKKMLLLK